MHSKQVRLDNKSLDLSISIGNALDLSKYDTEIFDMVICFGPMYHLREIVDRRKCLSECLRVLKPGGILCVAYININYVVPLSFKLKNPLSELEIKELIESGNVSGKDDENFMSFSHFDTPYGMEKLLLEYPVEILIHAGSEGIGRFISSEINELLEDEFKMWLSYHFRTCTDSSILGISNHGIVLVRK